MDEGSALLHHLERRFNRWLCSVAIGNSVTKVTTSHDNDVDRETLTICGSNGKVLEEVVLQMKELLPKMESPINTTTSSSSSIPVLGNSILLSEIDDEMAVDSKYLLVVCQVEIFRRERELTKLLFVYRLAKSRNCSVLLLVVVEDEELSFLNTIIRTHPELGILYCTKRIYTVARQRETQLLQQTSPVLRDWLSGVLPDDTGALEELDYADIFKIVVRDLHQSVPGLDVFLRLTTMVTGGLTAVLLTVIVLALISNESPIAMDVRQARFHLQSIIESQRLGKCEWGWRDSPSAIIALQLNDPSWCFSSESSQRSIDRMEIGLLSEISKVTLSSRRRRQLTSSTLAAYVNALLAVYLTPHSFHGHDLLSTLIQNMNTHVAYGELDNFLYGSYVIAIYNAGLELDRKHVTKLLRRQQQDGAFPLGTDEAAVTVLALTCFDEVQLSRDDLHLTLNYLMKQRQEDGSYGSILTTSLVTQVWNVTSSQSLTPNDFQETIKWLVRQTGSDVVRKNVHIAANLLMALNGKPLTHIRHLRGFMRSKDVVVAPEGVSTVSDQTKSILLPTSHVLSRYIISSDPHPVEEEASSNKGKINTPSGESEIAEKKSPEEQVTPREHWPSESRYDTATSEAPTDDDDVAGPLSAENENSFEENKDLETGGIGRGTILSTEDPHLPQCNAMPSVQSWRSAFLLDCSEEEKL